MNKQDLKEFQELQEDRWAYLRKREIDITTHPDFDICKECADRILVDPYYESNHILGISPNSDGFDDLYENYDMYRGSYCEIKVGDNYVIYGVEFD